MQTTTMVEIVRTPIQTRAATKTWTTTGSIHMVTIPTTTTMAQMTITTTVTQHTPIPTRAATKTWTMTGSTHMVTTRLSVITSLTSTTMLALTFPLMRI